MDTTILGRTGLRVSVAGLGCGGASRLGQATGASREDSVRLVREALDAGVTLIDTAAAYGTEEIVGEALRGRHDGVVVSTKVPLAAGAHADTSNVIDADALERGVDGCLARLGIDCIDVLHLHAVAPDQYDYACAEMLPRLERMREKGKLRFTGLTERFVSDTTHIMADRASRDGLFDVLMLGLNYLNQTALRGVLPQAKASGQGTLCMFAVRGPLARRDAAERLLALLVERGEIDGAELAAEKPLDMLTRADVAGSLAEAAYRFCRHAPGMDVTVTGTGNPAHLRANLAAIDGPPLPEDAREMLGRLFARVHSVSGDPTI